MGDNPRRDAGTIPHKGNRRTHRLRPPLPDGPFDSATIEGKAEGQCTDRVPSSVAGAKIEDLDICYLRPEKASWKIGDREVVCFLAADGPTLTASVLP